MKIVEFAVLTHSRLLLAAALAGSCVLLAGEADPRPNPAGHLPARSLRDILIESIPVVPLDKDVVLESGDIKVPGAAIDKVEMAYVAAEKRRRQKFTMSAETRAYMRKQFAIQFLSNALVEKFVTDNKLEAPKEQFEAEFKKFKESKTEDEAGSYEQWLADNGLKDEDFKRFWVANWTIEHNISKQVSDEDVTQALATYADKLGLRSASHILVLFKGPERIQLNVFRTKEEAKAAAEEILKKLKAGEDFSRLARASSDCPSKKSGGALGAVSRKGGPADIFGPAFTDAVYKLEKVGDYTPEPVESRFGYHLIRLDEIHKPEELRSNMRDHLVSEKYRKQMEQLMNNAAKDAKFNMNQL